MLTPNWEMNAFIVSWYFLKKRNNTKMYILTSLMIHYCIYLHTILIEKSQNKKIIIKSNLFDY